MNSSSVHIRRAMLSDADETWRLFQNHINWLNVHYGLETVLQRRLKKGFAESLIKLYPSAVAVHDDAIVGFTLTEVREIGVLEIMNMYVDDIYRNMGIGGAMLTLIEKQCHPRGVSRIIGFSSDRYYPGKRYPTGLFERAKYTAEKVGKYCEMYSRSVPLKDEEIEQVFPVRQTEFPTVNDIENERILDLAPGFDLDLASRASGEIDQIIRIER